ncbi:MAG: DUF5671 domain-containing protein [bacterium]|nr:DUF5671 domain-containing protein [bacterium]
MEPTTKSKTTARDFFLYLFAVIILYVSFGSLLSLLFDYINHLFPDALSYTDPYSGSMRFSIAILIILFPIFLVTTWFLNKDLRGNPEKQDMGIRKWLLYLTLFVASGIVIGDLVTLVNTFLNGEITPRFILKVLAVLVLSGLALWYYLLDLRGKYLENPKLGHTFGIVAGLLVLVSIVGGFFITGSPQSQRLVRFDQQKVTDLSTIQWQVINYWQAKQKLPVTLLDLKDPLSGQIIPIDPQSKIAYEYKVMGPLSFEMCATFNKESLSAAGARTTMPAVPAPINKGGYDNIGQNLEVDNWQHGVGRTCFERTIDPQLYPPFQKK